MITNRNFDKQGYRKLIVWRNACILRKRIYEITKKFPSSEYRRKIQMNDAARSVKQNIQEGYYQSIGKYIYVLKNICRSSLAELQGDVEDSYEDDILNEVEFKEIDALCGKTDYLFKRLVQSLESKSRQDKFNKAIDKLKKSP